MVNGEWFALAHSTDIADATCHAHCPTVMYSRVTVELQILGRDGDARRCPVCKHPIPESAKVTDFMMAPHILHEVRYPDKGFPADGPVPAPRGKGKVRPSLFPLSPGIH